MSNLEQPPVLLGAHVPNEACAFLPDVRCVPKPVLGNGV